MRGSQPLHCSNLALDLGPNVVNGRFYWDSHDPSSTVGKFDKEASIEAAIAGKKDSTRLSIIMTRSKIAASILTNQFDELLLFRGLLFVAKRVGAFFYRGMDLESECSANSPYESMPHSCKFVEDDWNP